MKQQNYKKSPMRSKTPDSSTLTQNNNFIDFEKVKILIRIRPFLFNESRQKFVELVDKNTLRIVKLGNTMHMKFSDILDNNCTQPKVFDLMKSSIDSFLNGINNTIFAYGQTGAGKTYTVIGNYPEDISQIGSHKFLPYLQGDERGILPRAIEVLIESLKRIKTKNAAKLKISFIEIYNEKIYDLLNYKGNKEIGLEIRETKNSEMHIPDLTTIQINTLDDAIECLMLGLKNRVTGSTHANSKSSRSHCIFQITLEQKVNVNEKVDYNLISTLRIVDLAGSEKFKIPHDLTKEEKDLRINELTSINGSLSCLGHCISALIEKSRTHIPFRNSKLTRVLSDSLSGNGKIWFIVCISPSISSSSETLSTLQFANRAKKAIFDGRNLKKKTEKISDEDGFSQEMIELHKAYAKEKFLREELEKIMSFSSKDHKLESEFIKLKKENLVLKEQIITLKKNSNVNLRSTSRTSSYDEKSSIFPNSTQKINQEKERKNSLTNEKKVRFNQEKTMDPEISDILYENPEILSKSAKKNKSESMSQFWKNHEEDSIINELPLGISSDNNNAIRLMKQKEVERKFQEFFSFNNAATAPQKIPQNQPQTSILRIKDQNDNRNHYQAENEPKKKPITTNNVRDENPLKTQSNCESKFELLKNALAMGRDENFYDPPDVFEISDFPNKDENYKIKVNSSPFVIKNDAKNDFYIEDIINQNFEKRKTIPTKDGNKNNIKGFLEKKKSNNPNNTDNEKKKVELFNNSALSSTSVDKSCKSFESITRKLEDKSINITNIVNDLQREMSNAVKHLKMLQDQDNEIKMIDLNEQSSFLTDMKFNAEN